MKPEATTGRTNGAMPTWQEFILVAILLAALDAARWHG